MILDTGGGILLLSMTGYGDARCQDDRLAAVVEVRTINNRYLKISTKIADAYAALEGEIEKIVREKIARGTVNVTVRVDRHRTADDYVLNQAALRGYWSQLQAVAGDLNTAPPADLASLLLLPGVIDDVRRSVDCEADWPVIKGLLETALTRLQGFRVEEGRSLERDLRLNRQVIAERLNDVVALAPRVVEDFRTKMLDRVRQLLAATEAQVTELDLIREVSIFAERADINEEILRLRCHLDQFEVFLAEPASAGRKLDFLTQEMFREVNTIGSKANYAPIALCVVEMKAAVDKIREVLQNVE